MFLKNKNIIFKIRRSKVTDYAALSNEEFLAIRRAISLNKRSFYFVEITTGETRHIQEIYIDGPSMHHCPRICIFKRGLP